jgi:hypothetical protein
MCRITSHISHIAFNSPSATWVSLACGVLPESGVLASRSADVEPGIEEVGDRDMAGDRIGGGGSRGESLA